MKQRYPILFLVILLSGCSASHMSAFPGTQGFASQDVVDPFNLRTKNVIHRYPLPHANSVPFLMATGSDKNVWFTEVSSPVIRIGKITQTGKITEYAVPNAEFATDIAAGASGTLWFTEDGASTIGEITTTGVVTQFPLPSTKGANYIAKGPDGNMWYTDTGQNGVGKITPTGTITEYQVPTSDAYPWDIIAGPDGNLWFTERRAAQVGKITTAGVITEYPSQGGEGPIAAGPDGNLYATTFSSIERITTSGVVTNFPIDLSTSCCDEIVLGPDNQMWWTDKGSIQEFNPTTHTFSAAITPDPSYFIGGLTVGGDGDVWIAGSGHNTIDVYEENLTSIGIRLNGEMSIIDPTYGFELGYAKGTGTTTQTISLSMGESVTFKNLDTIPHSAAFLGNASPSPSTWPPTFTGSTTKSPAGTSIGTIGFATGSLNPNQKSPVYDTGSPGFYMIGCQYHYVSNMMRTVVIVQ
jgi:streptogramin lyase/plastocyanin